MIKRKQSILPKFRKVFYNSSANIQIPSITEGMNPNKSIDNNKIKNYQRIR